MKVAVVINGTAVPGGVDEVILAESPDSPDIYQQLSELQQTHKERIDLLADHAEVFRGAKLRGINVGAQQLIGNF